MNYSHIIVKFGEIYTKKKNRKQFVDRLKSNIGMHLQKFSNLKIRSYHDHIEILLNGTDHQAVCEKLKNIFGISGFELAAKFPRDLNLVKQYLVESFPSGNSFKIVAKRKDKNFRANSQQIIRDVASEILRNCDSRVDIHHPEVLIKIVIDFDAIIVTDAFYEGAKGYPVNSSRALHMLSGGIDSPVAAYLNMKRGTNLEFIHFFSPPYTSDNSLEKVKALIQKLTNYHPNLKLYVLKITKLQEAIHKYLSSDYEIVILRRYMYRIMDILCDKFHLSGFSTGESLGQVASQTMETLETINNATKKLVIRPLICMDKLDIIKIAEEIDTYNISTLAYEDCCNIFNPKNPTTMAKEEKAIKYEEILKEKVDVEGLITEIIDNIQVYKFSALQDEYDDIFQI